MSILQGVIGKDPAGIQPAIDKVDNQTIPAAEEAVERVVTKLDSETIPAAEQAVQDTIHAALSDLTTAGTALLDRLAAILDRVDGATITVTIKLKEKA